MIKFILTFVSVILLGLVYYTYMNNLNSGSIKTVLKKDLENKIVKSSLNKTSDTHNENLPVEVKMALMPLGEDERYEPEINKTSHKDFSEKDFSNAEDTYRASYKESNFEVNPDYKNDKINSDVEYTPNENFTTHKSLTTSEFRDKESNLVLELNSDTKNYKDPGFDLVK